MSNVLIVGGSGMLGLPVARAFQAAGYDVTILARHPEKAPDALGESFRYARGDVGDHASLEQAMEGCSGVHVSLRAGPSAESFERVEHRGTINVAAAARRAGLNRITYLSGMYAGRLADGRTKPTAADEAKEKAEAAIRDCGVPYGIFRPTFFMETLARHVQGKRAVVIGKQPHPLHLIAADDYARMVVNAHRRAEAANRTFDIWGPEAITLPDALSTYCKIVAPGVKVSTVPIPLMRIVDRLFMKGELAPALHLMSIIQRKGDVGDPREANELLGAPTTRLEQWCRAQVGVGGPKQ